MMLAGGVFSWLVHDAGDLLLRLARDAAPVYPGHGARSAANGALGSVVADVCAADGRGRGGRGRVDYAAPDCCQLLSVPWQKASGRSVRPTQIGKKTTRCRSAGRKRCAPRTICPCPWCWAGRCCWWCCWWLFLHVPSRAGRAGGAARRTCAAALLVVVFGFLFVTVSARIVGIVGSSASPVSGMTIATLMATTAIFLVKRLDGTGFRRAGHYDWRHRVHRGIERGRHLAGPEDRLPDRRDAVEAAGGSDGGRDYLACSRLVLR